jgi:hypothetical protein
MPKLAFLFLTVRNHKCPGAWELFFKDVPTDSYSIYCHPKYPPTQPMLSNNVIANITPTRWGDISLVKATILLIREALDDPENQYFILVSDSCIPIVDFRLLYESISQSGKQGLSYIHYKHIPNRLDRYSKLSPIIRNRIKWKDFNSQHQWMILNKKHAIMCMKSVPKLIKYFTKVHAVDEHFFVTLFQILGVLKNEFINKKTTFCDWSDVSSMHPKTYHKLSNQFVYNLQSTGCFFVRKVSENLQVCPYLINCLTNFRKD